MALIEATCISIGMWTERIGSAWGKIGPCDETDPAISAGFSLFIAPVFDVEALEFVSIRFRE
jgi:hypothetical protein